MADDRDKASKKSKFKDWIDRQISVSANVSGKGKKLKEILKTFFNNDTEDSDTEDSNWDVIDPKGDGFCGLYAAELDAKEDDYKFDEEGILTTIINKEDLLNKLIEGATKFYYVRQKHINEKIPLPEGLNNDKFTLRLINVNPERTILINKERLIDKTTLKTELAQLENENNLDIDVLSLLAYAYNRSYLIIEYKENEASISFIFIPCYSEFEKTKKGKVLYPNRKKITLLFNNAHYFVFQNKNAKKKKKIVNLLKKIILNYQMASVGFLYNTESNDFIDLENNNLTTAINKTKKEIGEDDDEDDEVEEVKLSVKQLLKSMMLDSFEQRRKAEGEAGIGARGEARGEAGEEEE
jgi:hypothetical protein